MTNTKRRRSIFAVLLGKSKSTTSEEQKQRNDQPVPTLSKKELSNSDIVLIRPTEAKCVEATIVGVQQQQKKQGEEKSGKPMRKLRKSKSLLGKTSDADSYVLELNDQLEAQKLRISSSSSSSSLSSLSDTSIDTKSPGIDGDLWRTNNEYIPRTQQVAPPPRPPPPKPKPNAWALDAGPKAPEVQKRQRSPALEQFLNEHPQIQLDQLSDSSSSQDDADDDEQLNNSLSCDTRHFSRLIDPTPTNYSSAELMSDSDRRLYHWRKLAERSISRWQVPSESSDDDDDDSIDLQNDHQLDLMSNCSHSPALMCYCSDDTSCSSVELIWSTGYELAALELRRPAPKVAAPRRLAAASSSVSPVRSRLSSATDSPTATATPSPPAPHNKQLHHLQVYSNQSQSQSQNNNNNSLVSGASVKSWRQKPAVYELAKPRRARDRVVGGGGQANKRNSLDCSQVGAGKVVTSSSRASNEWVANPLFGPAVEQTKALRRGSSMEQVSTTGGGHKSPPGELPGETSGNSRFKSFLARLKRLEGGGGGKSKSMEEEENTMQAQKEEDAEQEEQFDSFSLADSTSAFERAKRHRWSLRMKSPFNAAENNNNYLGHHLTQLDKRIKSNVSSLGKRASVLADQLISSTKEQLLSAATGTSTRDRYDTLPNNNNNSFGVDSTRVLEDNNNTTTTNTNTGTSERRARQFSLIYKHQQAQQANGQPVITRQPTATGTCRLPVAVDEQARAEVNMEQIMATRGNEEDELVKQQLSETLQECQTIGACRQGREYATRGRGLRRKRLKSRRARRQVNVAAAATFGSDEDDEQQVAPSGGAYFKQQNLKNSRDHVTY